MAKLRQNEMSPINWGEIICLQVWLKKQAQDHKAYKWKWSNLYQVLKHVQDWLEKADTRGQYKIIAESSSKKLHLAQVLMNNTEVPFLPVQSST